MQLLDELNSITQKPLNLHSYFEMPSKIGKFKVRNHDQFMVRKIGKNSDSSVKKLTQTFIEKVVAESKQITLKQYYENKQKSLPLRVVNSNLIIYEYTSSTKPSVQVMCEVVKYYWPRA